MTRINLRTNQELTPHRITTGTIALGPNVVTAAAMAAAAVILPGHHKTAVLQAGYIRIILGTGEVGVDPELVTQHNARTTVHTGPNIPATASIMRT